jgi:hypothetical protein
VFGAATAAVRPRCMRRSMSGWRRRPWQNSDSSLCAWRRRLWGRAAQQWLNDRTTPAIQLQRAPQLRGRHLQMPTRW